MFLWFFVPFYAFYFFVVDKGVSLAPTYSSIAIKKSDLRSSFKSGKVMGWFYAFERSKLNDKSKDDHLRRWTLKRF